ncbi:MAG TPA: glycogen debranching N-terminal domain-containing protein [Dehalococcoidia bacterium]|nr:glycogen debranching N-terminal domain-containing protein [Dehalococcoidia bacterium]
MLVQDIRDALVIRERDLFLLTDTSGRIPSGNTNGYGLYYHDTRYLSTYDLSFSNGRLMVLLATAELGFSSEHVLTNFRMEDLQGRSLPDGSVEIHRTRVLEDVLEETIQVTNYNSFDIAIKLVLNVAADFADVFVVRGYQPEKSVEPCAASWEDHSLRMTYKGADGHTRQTSVSFSPTPDATTTDQGGGSASFLVKLRPRQHEIIRILYTMDGRIDTPRGVARFAIVEKEYAQWLRKATRVKTDNDFFDAVLSRSLADLRMLWNHEQLEGGYVAAGTPWFDTLFGRDTAIVGLQTLWLKPDLARQCLGSLARHQGKKFDPWRDEEPGKILHELRIGEMTQAGELPFSPYFGSVDSTPLFLLLAGEYFQWTADVEMMKHLETNIRAALHWIDTYGDIDKDGYVEYEKRSARGLVNQGWKDSTDSLIHADGSLLRPPIALVEVQGYVYAALRKLAPVFEALGDPETASQLLERAAALRERFVRDFWLKEGFFALALGGDHRPSASITTNPGHALWTGIATPQQAKHVVPRFMKKDLFSGWGLRTLSTESPRYNPQGYHLGTVWPHDNSIVASGFKRYGFEPELNLVATALFEAARSFPYYRLPELFGGTPRSAHHAPVPYPVACRPQAWAAGAFPLITQSILGLSANAPGATLNIVRPVLPAWLHAVALHGLRVGGAEADLFFERRGQDVAVQVVDVRGDLQVKVVDSWPD